MKKISVGLIGLFFFAAPAVLAADLKNGYEAFQADMKVHPEKTCNNAASVSALDDPSIGGLCDCNVPQTWHVYHPNGHIVVTYSYINGSSTCAAGAPGSFSCVGIC